MSSRAGLDVVGVKVDGAAVTIDLAGEQPPEAVGDLVKTVQRELDSAIEVVVRFSERRRLLVPETPQTPAAPIDPAPLSRRGADPIGRTSG